MVQIVRTSVIIGYKNVAGSRAACRCSLSHCAGEQLPTQSDTSVIIQAPRNLCRVFAGKLSINWPISVKPWVAPSLSSKLPYFSEVRAPYNIFISTLHHSSPLYLPSTFDDLPPPSQVPNKANHLFLIIIIYLLHILAHHAYQVVSRKRSDGKLSRVQLRATHCTIALIITTSSLTQLQLLLKIIETCEVKINAKAISDAWRKSSFSLTSRTPPAPTAAFG